MEMTRINDDEPIQIGSLRDLKNFVDQCVARKIDLDIPLVKGNKKAVLMLKENDGQFVRMAISKLLTKVKSEEENQESKATDADATYYAVWPGGVISRNDGEQHFVYYRKLVGLYRVNPDKCYNMNDPSDRKLCNKRKNVIHLYPRNDGNYTLD